jgi:L-ascorbate metabolism protein UlaG (beta-lactamase superfamily)
LQEHPATSLPGPAEVPRALGRQFQFEVQTVKLKLFLAILLAGFALPEAAPDKADSLAAPAAGVKITYLANEGFLIDSAGKRVLIDGLFRDGIQPYLTVPAQLREKLEMSKPPFERLDLILASHFHADHFDPVAVATHLSHNPDALFVSTNQAVEKLKSGAANFASLSERSRGLCPKEGERVRLTHRGIQLQILNVHHGRGRPIENLGLIWQIAGRKFFHIGDSMANAEDFKNYEVLRDRLDFAFIPYWYFLDEDLKKGVRDFIKPRVIVLMHIPERNANDQYMKKFGGWEAWAQQVKGEFPNAVIFDKQMQEKSFD